MKKLLGTLALTLACTLAFAQAEKNPNAPKIAFETDVIDYGTINQNADGKREFKFTNTGKEPLIITNCKGSCGCTVPSWPKEPIAPGESGVIEVKYATNRVGPINKSVTVNSNAATPVKVLRIKGMVKKVQPAKTVPVKEEKASMISK
jgi:hypothetical protein